MFSLKKFVLPLSSLFSLTYFYSSPTSALPVDWKGTFGVDSTKIDSYRRTQDLFPANKVGSEVPAFSNGNYEDMSYQSYVFNLRPTVIINDSATLHSELTTGYNRGGFLGDGLTPRKESTTDKTWGNALYLHNTSDGNANLNLSRFYLELFTDAATLYIGRQPFHWGLGAIWNSGDQLWDRYSTTQDGVTAKFKVANFNFIPYYAKINSKGNLTKAGNTKAYGLQFLYENIENDLTFGVTFARRNSGAANSFYSSGMSNAPLGRTKLKITDFYLKKIFGRFSFATEVPFISGDLGNVYVANQNAKYKAQAIMTESQYNFNENWSLGLHAGMISGDDGKGDTYEAFYVNPSYQIANLMFRYNFHAVGDNTQSLFDSYMVNARYAKLNLMYTVDSWAWNAAVIYAMAEETAQGGGALAYNHGKNKVFNSTKKQKDDLGYEVDLGMKYQWNPHVSFKLDLGYHKVGDFYAYTDDQEVKPHNSYLMSGGVGVQF